MKFPFNDCNFKMASVDCPQIIKICLLYICHDPNYNYDDDDDDAMETEDDEEDE